MVGPEGLLSGARRPPPQASGKRDPKGSVDHSRGRLRALIFSEAWCRLAVSLRLPAAPLGFLGFGGKTLKAQGGRLGERKSLLVRQQMMSRDWCRVAGGGREGRLWGRGPGPSSLRPRPSGVPAGPRPEALRLGFTVWTSRLSQVSPGPQAFGGSPSTQRQRVRGESCPGATGPVKCRAGRPRSERFYDPIILESNGRCHPVPDGRAQAEIIPLPGKETDGTRTAKYQMKDLIRVSA